MAKDLSGTQSGIVQENDVNNPSLKTYRGKNLFPQSFQHPSTCRYGEVDPVFAAKCEVGDVYQYGFNTDLDTFTLASKMKSKVNMKVAAFKVPMEAIYPRNWERMLTNPVQGDDVPDDTRALFNVGRYLSAIQDKLLLSRSANRFDIYVSCILLLEQVLSCGSLFSKFNMHFDQLPIEFRDLDEPELPSSFVSYFDDWFDDVFVPQFQIILQSNSEYAGIYKVDDPTFNYSIAITSDEIRNVGLSFGNSRYITVRRAIELLRTGEYALYDELTFAGHNSSRFFPYFDTLIASMETLVNIEPIVAYQLACAHFFSNSKVDFIYSAQLYRDNMQSLYISGVSPVPTYEYNGVTYMYDVFSARIFNNLITAHGFSYFMNLFQFQRSLRYGDYFTGSRVAPLAVGDINTPVVDGTVNALNMTRKLQLTRYLNRANISGPRIADYIRQILGGKTIDAPKDVPIKLSEQTFEVSGFEVNNTSERQFDPDEPNITTSALRLTANKYMFEVHVNEPCWLIGVQYFEAHRIYSRTMDRFAFHYDRFDDFIPDLQYTGDQEVKSQELDFVHGAPATNYAYNVRNMEYKQRYSYASGGFTRLLRTWAFITDNQDGNPYMANGHIDPEYIRSSPTEFDRFYKSLTGYSMGSYFHFITYNTNICAPYRQMVYAPEILA